MFNNWTVSKRLVAGFGIAAFALIAIAVVAYRNANRVIDNDGWVAHSHEVRADLARPASAAIC